MKDAAVQHCAKWHPQRSRAVPLASKSGAASTASEALNGRRSPCFTPFQQACGKPFLPRLVNEMTSETFANDESKACRSMYKGANRRTQEGSAKPNLVGSISVKRY
jgi:hypothetical protein